ncbi:MAG: amino acid ABC transporter permease [Anaerolineae bacterium]|nr:amino acid ABC transporter permease [Anaerolineae bacterium]
MNSESEAAAVGSPPATQQVLEAERARKRHYTIHLVIVFAAILVVLGIVLWLLGIDVQFMWGWLDFILTGVGYTLLVSTVAISLSVSLALFGALGRLSKNPIASGISTFYVSLVRGTPLLVQVYMWYLALPQIGDSLEKLGFPALKGLFTLQAIPAGILALGVCYGAYMTETFRAGIQSISKGQTEAAYALGMTPAQTLRRIILPQAIRVVIPPIGNDFIAMLKDSSLVSLMGVWELTFRATKIGRRYFRSLEMLLVAAVIYWIMTIVFQTLQSRLESHLARGRR